MVSILGDVSDLGRPGFNWILTDRIVIKVSKLLNFSIFEDCIR